MCYNLNMDLFTSISQNNAPLSERMRPETLAEFVGQKHIVGEGSLLRRGIAAGRIGSCIFYGPPGTGKTTLAGIIAAEAKTPFRKLNAVSAGVADVKKIIEEAERTLNMYGKRTLLLLDECHRWSKAQSDSVLGAIEKGSINFVGSTTENPYVAMTRAIISRCTIYELLPLANAEVAAYLKFASKHTKGLGNMPLEIDKDAYAHWAWASGGDLRAALNAMELAALTTEPDADGLIKIDAKVAAESIRRKVLSVDESLYYDMISAFCKSLRGSDPDAALYWSTRLIEAGCDPRLIARRLVVHASEDVGMADSNAMVVASSAFASFERLGVPEGLIPLSHAIIYVCCAPKSNAVVNAMAAAKDDVNNTKDDVVPHYLRDRSYPHTVDSGEKYLYPHDFGGYVEQEYLPKNLRGRKYYIPSGNGAEPKAREFLADAKRKRT